jgi:hypothetical protein
MKMTTLIVAVALATLAVFAAEAQAGSFGYGPPGAVLMKGGTTIQSGMRGWDCWHRWSKTEHSWTGLCGDPLYYFFPRANVVKTGARLHVRLAKPERPKVVYIDAYPRVKDAGDPAFPNGKYPAGKRQQLKHTSKPVDRNGKTVAWNVYFRVNEPKRHYYLDFYAEWKRMPGSHASYGEAHYFFHVKTR